MKCIISARYRVKIYKLGFNKAFLAFFANLAEMIRKPGQGRYVQPEYLRPIPNPTIQPIDLCRAQFYQTLLGQHEGGIYFTGLPGHIQVRDYIPGQVLYTPSIRTVASLVEAGPIIEERITIELDDEGYVEEVRCG